MKLFVVLLLAGAAAGAAVGRQRAAKCSPCFGEGCHRPPANCSYRAYREAACDRWVCAGGPGEPCGGRADLLGACGEGLRCECNTCTGCSAQIMHRGNVQCYIPSQPCINSDV